MLSQFRDRLRKRAKLFHRAYIEFVTNSDLPEKEPLTLKEIHREMETLFYISEPTAFSSEIPYKDVISSVQRVVRSNTKLCVKRREFIDNLLVEGIAFHHEFTDNQAMKLDLSIWVSAALRDGGYESSSIDDKTQLPPQPIPKKELNRGVIYAGRINELYKEAISFNHNAIRQGSIWTVSSGNPNRIIKELESAFPTPISSKIYNEENLGGNLYLSQGGSGFYSHVLVMELLKWFGSNPSYDDHLICEDIILAFFMNKAGELESDEQWLPKQGDLSLTKLIQIKDSHHPKENHKLNYSSLRATNALESLSNLWGVPDLLNSKDLSDDTLVRWDILMCHVNRKLELLNQICTTDPNKDGCLDLKGIMKAQSCHYIFEGEGISELVMLYLAQERIFGTAKEIAEFKENQVDYCPVFCDLRSAIPEGVFVLPATGVPKPIAFNMFLHDTVKKGANFGENFASIVANGSTWVLKVNGENKEIFNLMNERAFNLEEQAQYRPCPDRMPYSYFFDHSHQRILVV